MPASRRELYLPRFAVELKRRVWARDDGDEYHFGDVDCVLHLDTVYLFSWKQFNLPSIADNLAQDELFPVLLL